MSGLSREDKDLILKKLDVVSKELREIHFYEVAKNLGFKHIKTEDVRVIIGEFLKVHPTYKAVKLVNDENVKSATESIFTTVYLTECEYQTDKEFAEDMCLTINCETPSSGMDSLKEKALKDDSTLYQMCGELSVCNLKELLALLENRMEVKDLSDNVWKGLLEDKVILNRFLEINSVALKGLLAIAEWQERWTGISNMSDIEWMGADNRTSLLKRLKKMDNNELRTYFLNKGDKLDEYVMKLHNCFGLFVPKEEYEKLLKMRSEYKCIEWEIVCRFNQMEF